MAFHAFMSGRIIALGKQPSVHLVGVGETCRHRFSNIVINVKLPEATMECQDDQLHAGLKVRIDGAVHGVQAIWDE